MRVFKILKVAMLVIALAVILPIVAIADVPEVNHVMVTDVTTVSFSVIWAASESSTADLEVYEDVDGTIPVAGAVITSHPVNCGDPTIKTAAEDIGVMKVRVTGLDAYTTYYFRTATTSKSTSDITYEPVSVPLTPVTTEVMTTRSINSNGDEVPFSNDIIIEPCYLEDGVTGAVGSLLLATVAGGHYPVTAFVGDGVDSPFALIDLNNIFSRQTFENLDVVQGENLTFFNFRGLNNNSFKSDEVPIDNGFAELKISAPSMHAGPNLIAFPLSPVNSDTETVLSQILNQVSSIWAYNPTEERWIFWDRDAPPFLNQLTDLSALTGYWIIMDQNTSFKVNGEVSNDPIPLYPGPNLVGYRGIKTEELSVAITQIYENIDSIWTYDSTNERWIFYDKDAPPFLNLLTKIEPGKAYWILANSYCEW